MSETSLIDVSDEHKFDISALLNWWIPNDSLTFPPVSQYHPHPTLEIKKFSTGQSNPTFRIKIVGRDVVRVLRKQPTGKLLRGAHRVDREYKVMTALQNTDVPVPKTYALCTDTSVIGTMFYIMEYVEGRVFEDMDLPSVYPKDRALLYKDLARLMAALHAVDFEKVGLYPADGKKFGRIGKYCDRQFATWRSQYYDSPNTILKIPKEKQLKCPEFDELTPLIENDIGNNADETSIVHGDYRLGNCLIHPTESKIVAVLDWEISTLGHPLLDLAHLVVSSKLWMAQSDRSEGIPSEQEFVSDYLEFAGRQPTVANWKFFVAFAMWRLAAIGQGVYNRGVSEVVKASSTRALEVGEGVRVYSENGLRMFRRNQADFNARARL